MAGLTIQEMRLSPNAANAATLVLKAHPDARFTSGRRDVLDQARAMAQNVVRYGPAWLNDTYKNKQIVKVLMTYVEENKDKASSVAMLSQGFYHELMEHFSGQLSQFPHVRGDAFDIAWPRLPEGLIDRIKGEAICKTLETLPVELGLQLILRREGAHDVIHAQFNHREQVVQV